jgi:hypothetical protein
MMFRTSTACIVLAAGCVLAPLSPMRAAAQIPAGLLSAPNGYPKDFALVKRQGLFHVFYIESRPEGDFNYLGHQTSPDLYHWTLKPNVLVGDRADWNADFVWAPSIVQRDSTYWMFYTGVRKRSEGSCLGAPFQRIGVATSTDLDSWTMEPESWLGPLEVPWAVQEADSCLNPSAGSFRDPCVVWDPSTQQWVMLYVTVPRADSTAANIPHPGAYDPARYVVGEAHAPEPFAADSDWTDLQALWITDGAYPNGPGMTTWESPHAFSRMWQGDTLWFLFATTSTPTIAPGVTFMTGPSLTLSRFQKKGRTGWTWRGSITSLQIQDQYGHANLPIGWFASEYFHDPETGLEYFSNAHFPNLEFRQLKWRTSSDGFDLEQPFAIKELTIQPFSVVGGQSVDLTFRSVNSQDGAGPKAARLEALSVGADGESLGVMAPAEVGLPDSVVIAADVTHLPWKTLPPASPPLRLRVRLAAPWTEVGADVVIFAPYPPRHDPLGEQHEYGRAQPAPGVEAPPWIRARHPASGGAVLAFHVARRGATRLTVFDLHGRQVRLLLDRDLPRGDYEVSWDERDEAGGRAPAGIYFARLETGEGARVARIMLLRR